MNVRWLTGSLPSSVAPSGRCLFSVITLVSDRAEYAEMLASFCRLGFDGLTTEFIALDNTAGNQFDGYSGLRRGLAEARGAYVVCCHQDIRLLNEGHERLSQLLRNLDRECPDWAIAGNAGATSRGLALRISDPHGRNQRVGVFPQRVDTLDENFLVVRADSNLHPSEALSGFHLYGADLCFRARLLQRSAYVIDFHLEHRSSGRLGLSYIKCLNAIETHYFGKLNLGRVKTTCMDPMITTSRLRLWLARIRRLPRVIRIAYRVRP